MKLDVSEINIVCIDAMFVEQGFDLECGVALHASVRHDFMNVEPVAAQHALLRELHLAAIASVRFLARMRQHVSVEMALARKLQSAQRTLEFNADVRVHVGDVPFEAAVEREAASAVLALEGPNA